MQSPIPQRRYDATHVSAWRRWGPTSLFARVTLIIVVGLTIAQLLTFVAVRYERGLALRELMMTGVELDIASSVAILDRLPAAERSSWLSRLERPNYSFELSGEVHGAPPQTPALEDFADAITKALRPFPVTEIAQVPSMRETILVQVRLADGHSLVIRARRVARPISEWVTWVLVVQLVVLVACAWQGIRLVTRPLADLASAADGLGPDLQSVTLAEDGPEEVSRASRAFNAMQRRISAYMDERVEILAAISHDLQTPMTRMRLRTELMQESVERDKLRQDLDAMQALVREGLIYARTLHGDPESLCRLDVGALLESIVDDYRDVGQPVSFEGNAGGPQETRPQALRRIVTNLVDNALKFGDRAYVRVEASERALTISVLDSGPGIPADRLETVLKPFYRLEGSRNRMTGGTGLGLAIAQQLSKALGATLSLHNRPEGGLEARLVLPLVSK